MDKTEYYRTKVKKINEAHRTGWHPANNHQQRNKPSELELRMTRRLAYPGAIENPLVLMGWQYCISCFDIIARVICEDCLWNKEKAGNCTHVMKEPQADPSCQLCDWCYYKRYQLVMARGAKPQRGQKCEKCQKITNKRIMTYQNDTTLIICEDCQRERVDALIKGIGEAYFAQFEKDMLAATSEEAHIDD